LPHSNWYDLAGFNNHEGDWEGITVFLQKDRDGYYYPCRVAFGEHIFLVSEFISEGGEIFEWTELVKDNNILFSTNLGSRNDILAQSNVFVGLGGHASYPKSDISELSICTKFTIPTSIDPRCEEKHRGGKIYNLHDNLSLISSSDPKSREVVEYLPRVGVEKIEDLGDKSWLLYPGTWGNPKNCITRLPLDIGCPSAPRGPVFLDLKKISVISQPISKIAGITWESFGLGQRWLNPWKWSATFAGADKIKEGCPPPQEEPKPEPTPDIPRKPDGNTGVIYGDPHIVTFDGLRNSFQAVGEFILAKSERGDFEVQGRFKGVGDNASLPSAVAIKAGGERIGIYQGKLQINARNVNEASFPIVLEGGARVDKEGGEYRVIAPTGEWVEVSGSSVLTIKVTVPKSRLSKMYGLLGNYNNNPNDDLKTRQGKVVGINPNYDQLYKEYGNSWRIPQPESLFAYEVGETTTTFTNLNFPKKVLTLADFTTQQKQEAERGCRAAGVTASAMLESCMFDVLVTGDRSFANISAYVQSEVKVTANVTPTTKPTVPESQSGISLISKTSGVNYTRLRDLLAAGKWEEANGETIKVVSRVLWGKWEDIPCEDLRTINQLWLNYSNGKFGFSVQKEIYESLGGTRDYNEEVVEKLGDRVGWRKGGSWLYNYSDITFNLELAPKAHLPRFRNSGDWGEVSQRSLLEAILRAKTCEL